MWARPEDRLPFPEKPLNKAFANAYPGLSGSSSFHKTRRIFFRPMQIVADAALLESGGSLQRQKLPLDLLLQPGLGLK